MSKTANVPLPDFGAVTPGGLPHFAEVIVSWQRSHGRHTLPWQNTRDPYRVWLSEIMLQQTQVSTVLDYYGRFLERFPAVTDLAAASEDDVMALWSGLGYYSRARNMHRCAQQVVELHSGEFPSTAETLQTLPGIGRSTAAAIASFCFAERVAILDGNVKRVLTRVLAFAGDLAEGANERRLWDMAGDLLPKRDLGDAMPRYTQGLMDLGATVCTSRAPQCLICPVQQLCQGLASGQPERFPVRSKKLKRSAHKLAMLLALKTDGSVWLERRPGKGIWGGLYCLPVFNTEEELSSSLPKRQHAKLNYLQSFMHVLTHKDLYLSPVAIRLPEKEAAHFTAERATSTGAWFSPQAWPNLGLPAPIRQLLRSELVKGQPGS